LTTFNQSVRDDERAIRGTRDALQRWDPESRFAMQRHLPPVLALRSVRRFTCAAVAAVTATFHARIRCSIVRRRIRAG
jgi:hypothetical protein